MADFFDGIDDELNKQVDESFKKLSEDKKNDFEFDKLKMYFGEDYTIGNITAKQPTIGDIVEFGEQKVFSSIAPFTGNSTSYKLQLWELGIDWNDFKDDYKLFYTITYRFMIPENTKLIFGDLDFTKLIALENNETKEVGLYLPILNDEGKIIDAELIIDEIIFYQLQKYLRLMFNQNPKVQFAKGKAAKKMMIKREKEQMLKANQENKSSSYLLSLISACLNHPGFKYKKNELRDVGIVEFFDSVNRLQIYEQSTAFLKGMYSGFMSTDSMSEEQLNKSVNWMRDISA